MIANTLPKSLADNPRLDRWLGFDQPDRASVRVGKVEIGQGIATALCQIAAEELDIAIDRIDLTAGDTDHAPDEGTTTSSLSVEVGGASLRLVCAEVRALVLAAGLTVGLAFGLAGPAQAHAIDHRPPLELQAAEQGPAPVTLGDHV